jgi:transposase InsO family protein
MPLNRRLLKMKKRREWPFEAKLEAVKARQRGLSCREVGRLTGMSPWIVNRCLRDYQKHGEAGLVPGRTGPRRAPARRSAKTLIAEQAVVQLGSQGEGGGIGKVQGLLYRLGLLKVSRGTVGKVLERQGRVPKPMKRRRRNRPVKVRQFERAKPNDLWQTDIMTFMLRGQYRVYLIGFMDDNSRFIVGWGLFRRQTATNVQEVFRAAIEKHGLPKEVLSDNGRQYYTWRGKSQFTVMLTKLGIQHIRSRPYHPQTCGKIESFWRNVWQECLSQVPVSSFEDAEAKLKEYIEHYNYKRPHQGIGNLVPADRFYRVDGQVKKLIEENTAKVEEQKPQIGPYTPPTYLIGNIGGKELRVVAKDAEVSLREVGAEEVKSSQDAPGSAPGTADEANHGRTEESQAAESAGASGVDPAGSGEEGAGQGTVPAGGGVEGTILPVVEGSSGSGAEGLGGESAGPKGEVGRGTPKTGSPVEGGDSRTGGAGAEAASGTGPAGQGGGNGAADYPPQCMGIAGAGA